VLIRSTWTLLAGFSLLTICVIAQAAETSAAPDAQQLFGQLDANGDGTLSGDEVPAEKKTLFDRLVRLGDGNADGKLSADEFAQGLAGGESKTAAPADAGNAKPKPAKARPGRPGKAARPVPGRFLAQLDKNGDGKLTPDEVPEERREQLTRMIRRADKDGDGALSQEEFAAVAKQRAEMAKMRTAKPGEKPAEAPTAMKKNKPGPNKPGNKMQGQVQATPASLFRAVDKDRDGKLNGDEISSASDAIKSLDKNGDGTVTAKEIARGQQPKGKGKKPGAGKKKTKKPQAE
jgi:Ca2+-binding EF-hand superfamily protein